MFADRVFETTTTTGTGGYTLAGAQSGYRAFSDAFSNSDVVAYHCRNEDGDVWESGYGTLDTSANTLTRNVLASSTGSKINWTSGTKYIYSWPLSAIFASLVKGNLGTDRPGWLPAGGLWSDSANSLLKRYTGSADVALLPFALGSARQVLKVNSGATAPEYAAPGLNPGDSTELTIASGAITATGGHHSVDTESDAASDDLDTITVTALAEGEFLVLKAENAARVVTVKNGTGNITLAAGDFALDAAAKRLVLQKVGSDLVEVARAPGGGRSAKQATTSGSAWDFDIPAGVTKIKVLFDGVGLDDADDLLVQLGDSGGIEVDGYSSTGNLINQANGTFGSSSTAGFLIRVSGATTAFTGIMDLVLIDAATNTWVSSHAGKTSTTNVCVGGGSVALDGPATTLRIKPSASAAGDAGSVNIVYE